MSIASSGLRLAIPGSSKSNLNPLGLNHVESTSSSLLVYWAQHNSPLAKISPGNGWIQLSCCLTQILPSFVIIKRSLVIKVAAFKYKMRSNSGICWTYVQELFEGVLKVVLRSKNFLKLWRQFLPLGEGLGAFVQKLCVQQKTEMNSENVEKQKFGNVSEKNNFYNQLPIWIQKMWKNKNSETFPKKIIFITNFRNNWNSESIPKIKFGINFRKKKQ